MQYRATRPTSLCLAALTSGVILLLGLANSLLEVEVTDIEWTMSEPVSYTRFLCCACHDRGEGSAFFGTRRAAELHIWRSRGCLAACKGIKSVPVVYRDSQRLEDHEAGAVGAPGHWPARPVVTGSSAGGTSYPTYGLNKNIRIYRYKLQKSYDILQHVRIYRYTRSKIHDIR